MSTSDIKVTFFRTLNAESSVGKRFYSSKCLTTLIEDVSSSMTQDENYACFRPSPFAMIAVDRSGDYVMI